MLWKNTSSSRGGEAEYGRKGGEEDGTQARRGGVNDRTVLILLRFLLLYLFHQHNAVADQHPAQAQQANQRHKAKGDAGN